LFIYNSHTEFKFTTMINSTANDYIEWYFMQHYVARDKFMF